MCGRMAQFFLGQRQNYGEQQPHRPHRDRGFHVALLGRPVLQRPVLPPREGAGRVLARGLQVGRLWGKGQRQRGPLRRGGPGVPGESCGVVSMFDNEPIPRRSFELIADMLRSRSYMIARRLPAGREEEVRVPDLREAGTLAARGGPEVRDADERVGEFEERARREHQHLQPPRRVQHNGGSVGGESARCLPEKQQLAYWSIPQLRAALQKPKRLIQIRHGRKEMLRENFSRRLATILGQFRATRSARCQTYCPS